MIEQMLAHIIHDQDISNKTVQLNKQTNKKKGKFKEVWKF